MLVSARIKGNDIPKMVLSILFLLMFISSGIRLGTARSASDDRRRPGKTLGTIRYMWILKFVKCHG